MTFTQYVIKKSMAHKMMTYDDKMMTYDDKMMTLFYMRCYLKTCKI